MKEPEDEAFEELAKRQGDWGLQGSRKHQILRYAENNAMREVQRLGQEIEQEPVALPCCGYTDASAVKWNPFNNVVQCHNCGQVYTSQPQRKPLSDDECDAIYAALNAWARDVDEYDFGLPAIAGGGMEAARAIIREATA